MATKPDHSEGLKRSELKRRTELKRGDSQLKRTQMKRKPPTARVKRPSFTPASPVQREKIRDEQCIVCGEPATDPMHLAPRSHGGCEHQHCVLPGCRSCHRAFDDGDLDLTPFVHGRRIELAHMQTHYDTPIALLQRLSGRKWQVVP